MTLLAKIEFHYTNASLLTLLKLQKTLLRRNYGALCKAKLWRNLLCFPLLFHLRVVLVSNFENKGSLRGSSEALGIEKF